MFSWIIFEKFKILWMGLKSLHEVDYTKLNLWILYTHSQKQFALSLHLNCWTRCEAFFYGHVVMKAIFVSACMQSAELSHVTRHFNWTFIPRIEVRFWTMNLSGRIKVQKKVLSHFVHLFTSIDYMKFTVTRETFFGWITVYYRIMNIYHLY